jgi:hypothetical protein
MAGELRGGKQLSSREFAGNPIGVALSMRVIPGLTPGQPSVRPAWHRPAGEFVARIYFLNISFDRASNLAMGRSIYQSSTSWLSTTREADGWPEPSIQNPNAGDIARVGIAECAVATLCPLRPAYDIAASRLRRLDHVGARQDERVPERAA